MVLDFIRLLAASLHKNPLLTFWAWSKAHASRIKARKLTQWSFTVSAFKLVRFFTVSLQENHLLALRTRLNESGPTIDAISGCYG